LKNIITSADVDKWSKDGEREVHLEKDVVVTSFAEEIAKKLNIIIYKNDNLPLIDNNFIKKTLSNPLMDEGNIEIWRKEFPILKNVVHAGNCSQAPQSLRVRDSITRYLENWLTVGMDWDYWCEEITKAKMEFAKLINADVSEIAVTSCVSDAVAGLLGSLNYNTERNKIVTTEAEFPTIGQIALAHQKMGAKVDFVPVKNGVIDIDDYDRYIDETTLVTVATQVYYLNGFAQDIAAIAKKAHEKGSYYFVDCYQGLGTIPVDVKAMDIDFLTSGTLKYLLGIPGIAFLYVKKELAPKLKPVLTGWFGQENPFSFKVRELDYACDARRFDTGTPPVMMGFAARAGLEIINEIGVENISERIQYLSKVFLEGAIKRGLNVISPMDVTLKGSTTAIRVGDSHKVELLLRKKNIIGSSRGDVIRIAPHFFTRAQDLEYVLDELATIMKSI